MPQEFVPGLATFQAAVENSYDVVDFLREDGTILYVSPSVSRVLGFAPEDLIGKNGFDFVHPDDLPRLHEELAAARLQGKGEFSVCRCKNASGDWRWIKSTGSFLTSEALFGVMVIHSRDITEQEESRRSLLKTNEEMQTIWESMTDAFFAVDEQWLFTHINSAGERLLHRSAEQLVGRNLWLEFPEAVNSNFYRRYHEAIEMNVPVAFEEYFPPLSTWFEVHAYPSSAGLSVYFRNINQRKEAERQQLQAEDEQRKARHFLQSVLDALTAHVAVLNPNGEIIAVNGVWERFALSNEGRDVCCGVGANYLELCERSQGRWWQEGPVVAKAIRKVISGQRKEFNLEYACEGANGKRWFVVRLTRLDDEIPGRVVVTHEDVTETRQARNAVRYSQRLYQALTDNFPNGAVYLFDRSMKILLAGGRGLEQLGLTAGAIVGKTGREVFGREADYDRVEAAFNRALGGEVINFEVNISGFWRLVRAVPLFDDNSLIYGVMAMTQDISGKKEAEENRSRLAAIVESSGDAIIGKDLNGIITTWNSGAEHLYGYTAQEAIGQHINMLVPPNRAGEEDRLVEKHQRGEHAPHFETERLDKAGHSVTVSLASSPLIDTQGRIIGASQISRDITAQKQAEAERERFFTLSVDLLCICDQEGIFLRVNPAFEKTVGYSVSDLLGHSFLDFLHPEDRATSIEAMSRLREGTPVQDVLNRYRCADGTYRSILWSTAPYDNFFYGAGRDITAITEAKNQLQHSLALLAATLESTADGVLAVNGDGQITHYNQRFLSMWGLEERMVKGQHHSHPLQIVKEQLENPQEFEMTAYATLKEATREGFDLLHFKDGRVFERFYKNQVLGQEGVGGVWSFRDITERMQAEAEQSRFAALLEATTDFVGWTDIHCLVQYINPAGRTMIGLDKDEPIEGRPIRDFAPAWSFETVMEESIPYASKNGSWTGELAVLRRDGQEVPVSQVITAHKDSNGRDLFFSTIARDISESKRVQELLKRSKGELEERVARRTAELAAANKELQAEIFERQMAVGALREVVGLLEQARLEADTAREKAEAARLDAEKARELAEQANLAKSEFLSRMSHELRTPMNAILGFGQILEMRRLGARENESVHQILKAGQHLLQLINEILEISRIEAGELSISIEPVPVEETVLEALDLVRPLARQRKISLFVEENAPFMPMDNVYISADRQRLRQVFLNLVSNAVKYNREEGSVTISLRKGAMSLSGAFTSDSPSYWNHSEVTPTQCLRLEIHDTGPGIPPEDHEKLFLPFERLGAEATSIEGTGIGLALAKRLTELMQGRIGVESESGFGSTFWIELPLSEDPHIGHPAMGEFIDDDDEQEPLLKFDHPVTLLYIEDNASNLNLLESFLNDIPNIRLLTAIQGRLGLDLAQQHHPSLVLLDLHLPDIMGEEVLLELKSHPETFDIPVVILSADATEKQIEKILGAGATDYLTKPLNIKNLLKIIQETVSQAQQ